MPNVISGSRYKVYNEPPGSSKTIYDPCLVIRPSATDINSVPPPACDWLIRAPGCMVTKDNTAKIPLRWINGSILPKDGSDIISINFPVSVGGKSLKWGSKVGPAILSKNMQMIFALDETDNIILLYSPFYFFGDAKITTGTDVIPFPLYTGPNDFFPL